MEAASKQVKLKPRRKKGEFKSYSKVEFKKKREREREREKRLHMHLI